MVVTSTHQNERYDVYEAYTLLKHIVTNAEATANAIVIELVEPHAVVIADEEYARGYANGVISAITNVEYDTIGDPNDATITFTSLIEGESVDIYFPVTGTGSGSLVSNTNTGKLSLPRIQTIQRWQVPSNMEQVSECGTKRKRPIEFPVLGAVTLGLHRFGNTAMADFIAASEGKSNGDKIFLIIDVVDTTVATATHDLLLQARVKGTRRTSQAINSEKGIITDTITFSFVPPVVPFDAT
jgi:hypothetical protein